MDIFRLIKNIPQPEFDYQTLLGALGNYASPRSKITDLLAKRVIIRVKKGIYIFGDDYRTGSYSREVLANLIYGPSCISLEYALSYYGLIPEHTEVVTSVSPKRSKNFTTPIGVFNYHHIPEGGFSLGIDRIELNDGRAFLMAGPEKALADKLRHDRGLGIRTQRECLEYLVSSWRIDPDAFLDMNVDLLKALAKEYRSQKVQLLADLIRNRQRKSPS